MSRRCEVTGRGPLSGNHVSHAHNKTRRRFLPNLHLRRFWSPERKRYVRLKVSARGIRLIDRLGIDRVLDDIAARKRRAARQ